MWWWCIEGMSVLFGWVCLRVFERQKSIIPAEFKECIASFSCVGKSM